jgi:hypothetical protein
MTDANGYDDRPYDPRSALAAEQLGDLDPALDPDASAKMTPWRTQESHTSRAYTYEAITSVLGRDVRVTVYRESADYQSYACAEMLTPSGWQPLDRLLDPSIWHSSYASTTAALRRHAEDDRVELLATAAQLIAHLPS